MAYVPYKKNDNHFSFIIHSRYNKIKKHGSHNQHMKVKYKDNKQKNWNDDEELLLNCMALTR